MAKTRHQPEPSSNKGAMALMALGGLLVGALVVWALTRTVEVTPTTSTTTAGYSAPAETPTPVAVTSTDQRVPVPSQVPPGVTATSTAAPHPPEVHGDRTAVQRIAVEDLRAKMNRNEVTVLDVRDANSYNAKHIQGAINVPFASIESMLGDIPKDKPIVTYCTWPAEESSAGAALILKEKGFSDVHALYGGFHSWTALGYPTTP